MSATRSVLPQRERDSAYVIKRRSGAYFSGKAATPKKIEAAPR